MSKKKGTTREIEIAVKRADKAAQEVDFQYHLLEAAHAIWEQMDERRRKWFLEDVSES